MVGVMTRMATSLKRTCTRTVVFSAPDPAAGHCRRTPPLETPAHSQASLAQSPTGLQSQIVWGGSQSFCWIPRLGNLLWVLEL